MIIIIWKSDIGRLNHPIRMTLESMSFAYMLIDTSGNTNKADGFSSRFCMTDDRLLSTFNKIKSENTETHGSPPTLSYMIE